MVSTARVNTAKASSVEKVYNKKDREEKERSLNLYMKICIFINMPFV